MSGSFVVGVIADLSGGAEPAEPRFHDVDRDDLDAVLRRLAPRVSLELPFCPALELNAFEDLHPDRLADRTPALAKLLEAREAVGEPSRMRELIEASGASPELSAASPEAPARPAPPRETTGAQLLDAIVSDRPVEGRPRIRSASADPAFDRVVAEIADRSADRTDYAQQERFRTAIDAELAARARAILHHPRFLALESAWRSLRGLVMQAETGEGLRLRALDLSRAALAREAGGGSLLERLVVEHERGTRGGAPFGLLVVDHAFGTSDEDLAALGHLAAIAASAEAPCVAALASEALALDEARLAAWTGRLRALPGARWLALCGPRLLLRLPYGAETEPLDRFAFEEAPDGRAAAYCWGSAGFALAAAAVEAVADTGRASEAARYAERGGLPLHVYRAEGEIQTVGPTERLLPDAELEWLRGQGLTPLAGARGQDTAYVGGFRSLTGEPLFVE